MNQQSPFAALEEWSPLLIISLSIAILGTAFASEIWGGLQPCHLCWLQRYPYMVTIALGILAAVLQKAEPEGKGWRILVALTGVAFAAGGGIALYHMGVEYHWWKGPESCTTNIENVADLAKMMQALIHAPVIRCDVPAWTLFGLSMAGYNLLASLGMMLISFTVIPGLMGDSGQKNT
jgi:disulfide bond formation protein DsbB